MKCEDHLKERDGLTAIQTRLQHPLCVLLLSVDLLHLGQVLLHQLQHSLLLLLQVRLHLLLLLSEELVQLLKLSGYLH